MNNNEAKTCTNTTEERLNDIEKHLLYQVKINSEFFNIFRGRRIIEMEITIKGTPKEMADLVRDLQSQPKEVICEMNIDGKTVAQAASSATRDSLEANFYKSPKK